MVASTLICPHCQASIRSSKPVPVGTQLKCPKCATSFVAMAEAVTAAPHSAALTSQEVRAAGTTAGQATAGTALQSAPNLAQPGHGRRVLMLVLGGAMVLILSGVLVAVLWRPGNTPEDVPAEPWNPEIVLPKSKKKSAQPLIVLTAEEEARVKEATRKGVDYLKKFQAAEGHWDYTNKKGAATHRAGATALAALTLLESGVAKDDPVIVKAAQHLRGDVSQMRMTYDLALAILFFDKLGDAADKQHIWTLGLRLVAGQGVGGGWTYGCPILTSAENDELAAILRRLGETRREALENRREALTVARTTLASNTKRFKALPILKVIKKGDDADFQAGGGDNSNTQFALLGLWASRRHDVPVDPSLALVGKRFRATQNKDGSFSYRSGAAGKPSMTCAGLLGLAVSYGIKEKGTAPPPLQDQAIKDALKNLGKHIDNPGKKGKKAGALPALYFLWSVERVAVLYQLKEIEGKRWYHWGMELLLAHQKQDGHWGPGAIDEEGTALANTCFALLFLQRVNLASDLTDKLEELQAMVGANLIPFREDDD